MEKEKQNKQNKPGKERKEGHPDPGKIINFVGSKMKPDWYQNDTNVGSNMILSLVSKRYLTIPILTLPRQQQQREKKMLLLW